MGGVPYPWNRNAHVVVHPGNNHWIVLPCLATTIIIHKVDSKAAEETEIIECKGTLKYLKINVITCFPSYKVLGFKKPLLVQLFSYKMFDQGYLVVVFFCFSFDFLCPHCLSQLD